MTLLSKVLRSATPEKFSPHSPAITRRTISTPVEALRFVQFLSARIRHGDPSALAAVPHLSEVVSWEGAVLRAHLAGRPQTITWTADPVRILAAIDSGRVPDRLPPAPQRVRIESEAATGT